MPLREIALERQAGDVFAVEYDAAAARPQHAGQAIEKSALAGAVRSDDGADFAARNLEIDVGQRRQSAEADGQPFGREDRRSTPLPGFAPGSARRSTLPRSLRQRNCRPAAQWSCSGHCLDEVVGAAGDREDELAQEGLVVFLAERLVALREIGARLQLETFERLDELHGVVAALELRLLHADLERVERLEVRLHVFIGQRTGRIDLSSRALASSNKAW